MFRLLLSCSRWKVALPLGLLVGVVLQAVSDMPRSVAWLIYTQLQAVDAQHSTGEQVDSALGFGAFVLCLVGLWLMVAYYRLAYMVALERAMPVRFKIPPYLADLLTPKAASLIERTAPNMFTATLAVFWFAVAFALLAYFDSVSYMELGMKAKLAVCALVACGAGGRYVFKAFWDDTRPKPDAGAHGVARLAVEEDLKTRGLLGSFDD